MMRPTEDWIPGTAHLRESGAVDDDDTLEGMRTGALDHLTHALYVKTLVECDGLGVDQAIRRAAARYGVPEATIERHYEEHGHAVEGPASSSRGSMRTRTSLAGAPGRRAIWVREPMRARPT